MNILNLTEILPPPQTPVALPSESDWKIAELVAGKLHTDYYDIVNKYGEGVIDDFIWVFIPGSTNVNLNFLEQVKKQKQVLNEIKIASSNPEFVNVINSKNLTPFAITDNGDLILWSLTGSRTECSIIVIPPRLDSFEMFEMGPIDFLVGVLNNNIRCISFPEDFPSDLISFQTVSVKGGRM